MDNYDYVILCDSSSKLEDIVKIHNKTNALIITFDYISHNYFLKNNLKHTLSDDCLSDEDLDNIQDLSYKFSSWYNESFISNLIQHEDINIGELYYIELGYFLSPLLKKIHELKKITSAFENPYFFVSNSIIKFLKLFSSNFEPLVDENKKTTVTTNNELSLKFTKIKVKTDPANSFLNKTVNLSYSIFNSVLYSEKINNDNPIILFVNFTTLRMNKFLEELPNHHINLIKYDTTIPAFWNLTTLSLIKKSGCRIENNHTISKNSDFLLPKKSDSLIRQKLNDLKHHDSFFEQFFSTNEISFWPIIKNDFFTMFSKNYENAIKNISRIKYLFKKYQFSYIVLLSESDPLDLVIIHLAKKFGLKTSILQHALYYDDLQFQNYYSFKSDQFQRVIPKYSDNFLVWGKLTQIHSEKHGMDNKKIISTGCPFFDTLVDKSKSHNLSENQYILLATTPITYKNQTRESSIKTQIEYNLIIKEICKITTKINKNLLIKIHHGSRFNDKETVNKINPNIAIETTGSFYQYAIKCEVLICIDMSTAILEAMLLKKPVILVLLNDEDSHAELFTNDYLIIAKISELEDILVKLSKDISFKNNMIKNQEKFVQLYLDNIGNSSKTLLNFLEHVNNKKS